VLTYFVVRHEWGMPAPLVIVATAFFLALDALLVSGCAIKFVDGGWFPLLLGGVIFVAMSTWWRGRSLLLESIRRQGVELEAFVEALDPRTVRRVERTAIYPVADQATVPQALLHNLKHNQVLHERNVVLNVKFHDVPWIPMTRRVEARSLGRGFWLVVLHFGFMNTPDVPKALTLTKPFGLSIPPFESTYFLSRETVVPASSGRRMSAWRERLFATMTRFAAGAAEHFRLPDNAVVELGTRVQL
jgi:KUP system potassium uptake protein